MPNITLSVDDEVIRKVRKLAIDHNTTLTAMVREYLISLAAKESQERETLVADLKRSFQKLSRKMGPRRWTRDSLHER